MGNSPYSFADLSTPETQATIRARLVTALTADGLPASSWVPSSAGGSENLRLDMVSGALAQLAAARIAALCMGRLIETATDSADTGYFLSYLGKKFYRLTKYGATKTVQNMQFICGPNSSAQSFTDGQLTVRSPATGNRYVLSLPAGQSMTLAPNTAPMAPFAAATAGASYLDPPGTVTQLVTSVAGVTVTNVQPSDFLPARQVGSSPGTVAAGSWPGTTPDVIRIRIDASGNVGSGAFSVSIDGGLTWVGRGVIPPTMVLPGGGARLAFTNGPGATTSFVQGSFFTIRAGSSFLAHGTDAESDPLFRRRCKMRWPALSAIPTAGAVELWARTAAPEVLRVWTDADPSVPGGMLVTVASAAGAATPSAQAAIEDFVQPKLAGFVGVPAPASPSVPGSTSPAEMVTALSATVLGITAAATITIPANQLAAAQAVADEQWEEYLATIPIDGSGIVEMEVFYRILGDLGAVDVQGLTLNGVAADLAVPAGSAPAQAAGYTLLAGLSWQPAQAGTAAPPAPPAPAPGSPFAADPQSISDLIPALGLADFKAFLLAYISIPANEITDWESNAALRTYWELESQVIYSLCGLAMQKLADNGYPDTATGTSLTRIALYWYDKTRAAAAAATQNVTLFCDPWHGPYSAAQVASVVGLSSDGVRYDVTAGAALLGTNSSISVTMTAETTGTARGLVASLDSGLPGVVVQAAAIATFGAGGDSDADVTAAIDDAWPDLTAVPVQDRLIMWALAAAPPPLVTRFRMDPDAVTPGGVVTTLANAGGAVAGGTVTAVQAAFDKLSPITDYNTTQNSTNQSISATGTVTVRLALLAQAQTQADAAWTAYLAGVQIGSKVYLQALRQIIGDAIAADPASNFTGEALTGAGGDGNIALPSSHVPIVGTSLTAGLTWVAT